MESQKIICVDIGATKIHLGVVQNGVVLKQVKVPTAAHAPQAQVLEDLANAISPFIDAHVAGIGIGAPGLVDEHAGYIYDVVNIPSWKEVPIRQYLQGRFQLPVYLTNDANTFVLGEKVYGQARNYQNVVGLTLGTGLGAGLFLNNSLYTGSFSGAGEYGTVPYRDKTFDDYCGGKFFLHKFGMDGSQVQAAAEAGDKAALEAFREYGQHLSQAVQLILYTVCPEAIFLGGSVSKSFHLYQESLQEHLQAFPFKRIINNLVIRPSALEHAALLGAAALCQLQHTEKPQAHSQAH
ncbi:ROK family protein [Pontibacter sp. CAU 1760]